jgi:hypothetical protein
MVDGWKNQPDDDGQKDKCNNSKVAQSVFHFLRNLINKSPYAVHQESCGDQGRGFMPPAVKSS